MPLLAYGTGAVLAIAGIAGREVNAGVLTIWLGFVAAVLGVGGVSGYGKRTTDLDYQLAKKRRNV